LIKPYVRLIKWLWLILVAGAVLFYVGRNMTTIKTQVRTIVWTHVSISLFLIALSKLLLTQLSRQSVLTTERQISFPRMFYINSMSQLAKYIPGGIWHLVGRAGYYHGDGLSLGETAHAMVAENIWLVSGAFTIGLLSCVLYYAQPLTAIVVIVGVVAVWWSGLWTLSGRFKRQRHWRTNTANLVLQAAIWILLGMSLWVILPHASGPHFATLAIGTFGLSWAIGYLAIFAPGGIGVREPIIVALLAPVMSPTTALLYASTHRILWVIMEILLGLLAQLVDQSSPAIDLYSKESQ
jgi:hypothetical protein